MHVTQESSAPADTVWAIMTDLERWPSVVHAIESVERLDDGKGFEVGTRWRETRTMFGRRATETMEVRALDPGRSYTVGAVNRGVTYTSVASVEPTAEGCIIGMSFEARSSGFTKVIGATVGKLFEGATRKALLQDLRDIAEAAEAA
jgi:uncharacterized membrane protein